MNGKEITPLKYENEDYFYEGFARATLNHKYGYVNKKGKLVWKQD